MELILQWNPDDFIAMYGVETRVRLQIVPGNFPWTCQYGRTPESFDVHTNAYKVLAKCYVSKKHVEICIDAAMFNLDLDC